MKKIVSFTIIVLIILIGMLSFVIYRSVTYQPSIHFENINPNQIVATAFDLEEYDFIVDWVDAYNKNIDDYTGRTDEVVEEYAGYVTEEQEAQLRELEDGILNATKIKKQKELIEQYETIVQEIDDYMVYSQSYVAPAQSYNSSNYSSENYSSSSDSGSYTSDTASFKRQGVVYQNGTRYTWYSQKVLPGNGLNIPGRNVGSDNLVHDGDGYIAVASNDHAQGTVVDTPFGQGKVYDSGCDSGTIDIYTNF